MRKGSELTSVNFGGRIGYLVVDSIVFVFVWFFTLIIAKASIPHLPIKGYTEADYFHYVIAMSYMTLMLFISSIITHKMSGQSAGQFLAEKKVVTLNGDNISWKQSIIRSTYVYSTAILILAPRPLSMLLGETTKWYQQSAISFIFIFAGLFMLIPAVPLFGEKPLLEQWLGIVVVEKSQLKPS